MSNFLQTVAFICTLFDAWVFIAFAACFVFLTVMIIMKTIKTILDALPFV
jgi:hypothetical protein